MKEGITTHLRQISKVKGQVYPSFSEKRVHTRGHSKEVHIVKQKTEDDNNTIEADKKGQWSCLEQFLVL